MDKFMKLAKDAALEGIKKREGGPFGAVIVKDDVVISIGNNKVLDSNDPTAHAEIVAIREASRKLKTYDLSGCELYTSAYPCPMCLSAIIWANIDRVYYGCYKEDAENIGFRDNFIYEILKGNISDSIDIKSLDREECLEVFNEYQKNNGIIY